MEKVDKASTASDNAMKRLLDEFERANDILMKDFKRAKETLMEDFDRAKDDFDKTKDILGKSKNQIHEVFEELREDQDAFAVENGVLDVDGS